MGANDTHEFGGNWTDKKLEVLSKYLSAYTTALKNFDFRKGYIDAFAGTGYRTAKRRTEDQGHLGQELLFPDLADGAPQSLLDGSARLALATEPGFDNYIFIEKNPERARQLRSLQTQFPNVVGAIDIRQTDANTEIRRMCRMNWTRHRAVLFLDPYGMQVEWQTLEAVAGTKAIDMWLLFPLGMGVNRLLTRSGDIPLSWRRRLDLLLGTADWYDEFYRVVEEPSLFGEPTERVNKATMETIGKYFIDRLKTIFAGVADHPGVLSNSTGNPLYLLCFAVGNPRGVDPALNIANDLLRDIRQWQ